VTFPKRNVYFESTWPLKRLRLKTDLSGKQVDDLEAVLDDPDSHQLLAVVAAVHHQRVDLHQCYQTFIIRH